MIGYNSIKDYILDQKLLLLAGELDLGRRGEMDIEKLMRQNIKERLKNASKLFQNEMKKNKYTELDLKLLTANENDHIETFREFYEQVYGTKEVKISKFKQIIKSRSFKDGKLHTLTRYIPIRIDTPRKLLGFLRRWKQGITDSELEAVMSVVAVGDWESWLQGFIEKDNVFFSNGRWHY